MSINYKETLNLPKTKFSMKAALSNREPQWLNQCDKDGLYQKLQDYTQDRPTFIMHDGPPYANGSIHIGHAVNKILKDIVVKSKLMSGFRAPYIPGWDCHGLPIEIQVEKKVGKVGQKVDAATFRQKCREYADRQVEIQKKEFKRLGVIGDWDNPYLTKSFEYEADMVRALAKIVENNHVVKGVKPVNWCFDCGSALAEAEIEYQDKQSPAIDVAFEAVNSDEIYQAFNQSAQDKPVAIPIWTTTPWTLPANQAVALNAELDYSLLSGHEQFVLVVANDLLNEVIEKYQISEPQILSTCKGEALENIRLKHPFYERKVPVILGDHVTTDAGTGAVHTAPGHGADDFVVGKKYNLEIDNPVAGNGVYLDSTPLFAGQHIWKANQQILEILKENAVLLNHETIEHSYPHCWRHKTPTAFRTTPQWFVAMDKNHLRQRSLDEIKNVKWVPAWGENRIYSMIENRPEWCISRQRTWGVPITLFTHKETGELHPDTLKIMESVAQKIETKGMDAWFDSDGSDFIDDIESYEKASDVLDVWFDSGVTHFAVLKARAELQEPADLYLEGSDQHRGWFHSSLLTGVAINNRAPYKQVLTHGFVVDKDGKKMSKSIGNVVSPKQIVDTMGGDILRLWVASADYRNEITISDEILKRVADGYRRIRNTARFLIGNLHDFDAESQLLDVNECTELDKWAIQLAADLQTEIKDDYHNYQFHLIYQKLHHFCSQDMGAFYLDVLKDRLYTCKVNSKARNSAQTAMYHILQAMVRWMAPIITFTADEIWKNIGGEQNVLFETFYEIPEISETSSVDWTYVQKLRTLSSKLLEDLRGKGEIGSSLEANVEIYLPEEEYNSVKSLSDELRFVLITSGAKFGLLDDKPESAVETQVDDLKAFLNVTKAKGEKCVRCWHIREDVGSHANHPEICGRCVENVEGQGENREFA